jgi:hypothetical protein
MDPGRRAMIVCELDIARHALGLAPDDAHGEVMQRLLTALTLLVPPALDANRPPPLPLRADQWELDETPGTPPSGDGWWLIDAHGALTREGNAAGVYIWARRRAVSP